MHLNALFLLCDSNLINLSNVWYKRRFRCRKCDSFIKHKFVRDYVTEKVHVVLIEIYFQRSYFILRANRKHNLRVQSNDFINISRLISTSRIENII